MAEKEPQVTFTDRRKISVDGEIRPEAAAQEELERREEESRKTQAPTAARPTPIQATKEQPRQNSASETNRVSATSGNVRGNPAADGVLKEEPLPEGPTAQESAESQAAYRETTQQLDEILRSKAPDTGNLGPVSFEHLVQSMYVTAMMSLGAGTRPGEKPRVDLMGARQTIDLIGVLQEKTKGNLTKDEQRLLESALFELRMMFLEITNAIARNASAPKAQG